MQTYSTGEAARYVGLSLVQFKRHIAAKNVCPARRIGANLVFEQTELDRFKAVPRPTGRPRGKMR